MGSRFHALPTDRTVESNEPGIGAHTDVAMTRDTDFREPSQAVITEPPFAYRFNADGENCECSLLERIKSFFTGKSCCEGKEVKEANSVTGQTPYFGVGFDGKNTQTRVIKETNPVSLDPSTAPYIPQNLSGYTGQAYHTANRVFRHDEHWRFGTKPCFRFHTIFISSIGSRQSFRRNESILHRWKPNHESFSMVN